MKRFVTYLVFVLLLASCLEQDPSISKPSPEEFFVALDPQSTCKVFVSAEHKEVSEAFLSDSIWHLKFQNGKDNWAIFLNPLEDLTVHNTGNTDYAAIDYAYVLENIDWYRDVPLPNSILPAIGTWGDYSFENPKSFRDVYLLRAKIGLNLSYYKFQILDASGGNYRIRFGKLDGSVDVTYLVQKDLHTTHSYLRLGNKARLVRYEAPLEDWDLCFGYGLDSIVFQNQQKPVRVIDPYLGVVPVISFDKATTSVAIERDLSFEEIDYFYVKRLHFEKFEQVPNVLAAYNYDRQIYEAAENTSLILKKGDLYFKIRATSVSSTSPQAISILLAVQSL